MRFEKYPRYTLRKLTIGLASVIVGTNIVVSHSHKAHAAEVESALVTNGTEESSSSNNLESVAVPAENSATVDKTGDATPEKSSETVPVTNSTSAESTPEVTEEQPVAKDPLAPDKPSDIRSDADPKNPIVKEDTNSEGKPSDEMVTSDDKSSSHSKYAVYYTFKDKDGKEYSTAYLKNGGSKTYLDSLNVDLSSLTLNVYYENQDQDHDSLANFILQFNGNLRIDSSRLDGDIKIESKSNSNYQLQYSSDGNYRTYDQLVSSGKDIGTMAYVWFRWEDRGKQKTVKPGDVLKWQIPLTYKGDLEGYTNVGVTDYRGSSNAKGGLSHLYFQAMYPQVPVDQPTPSADENPVTLDESVSSDKQSEWVTTRNGEAVAYLKFTGLDGKEYVTPYFNGNINTLNLDYDKIDPNSFELVLNYRNGAKKGQGMVKSFWSRRDFRVNTDKMTGKAEQTSGSGKKYDIKYKYGANETLTFDQFIQQAGSLDKLDGIVLRDDKIEGRDSVQVTVPLKYIGNGRTTDTFTFGEYYKEKYPKVAFDRALADIQIDSPTGGRDNNDHESTNPIVLKNYDQVKDQALNQWFDFGKGQATIYLKFMGKDGKEYVTPYISGSGDNNTTPDFLVDYSQIDPNTLELVMLYQNGNQDYNPKLNLQFNDIYRKMGYQVDPNRHPDVPWTYESKLHNEGYYQVAYFNQNGKIITLDEAQKDGLKVTDIKGLSLWNSTIEANDLIKLTVPLLYKGDHVDRAGISLSSYKNGDGILDVRMANPMYSLDEINMYLYPNVKYGQVDENGKVVQINWIHNEELDKILNDAIKNGDLNWDDLIIWDNYGHLFSGKATYDPFRTDYTGVYDPSERTIYSTSQAFLNLKEIQRYLSVHGYSVEFAKNTHNDNHLEPMQIYAYGNNQLKMVYEENVPGGGSTSAGGSTGSGQTDNTKRAIKFYFSIIPSIIVNDTLTYYVGNPNNPKNENGDLYWDPRKLASHAHNVNDKIGSKDVDVNTLLKGYYDPSYDSDKGFSVDIYNNLPRLDPYEKLADGSYQLTVTIYEEKDDGSLVEVPEVDLNSPGKYTVIYSRVFYGDERKPVSDYVTAEKRLEADATGKAGELILNKSRVIVLDVEPSKETKEITRTISYLEEGTRKVLHDPVEQKVTFEREVRTYDKDPDGNPIDPVTVYGEWTKAKIPEVPSPDIDGYHLVDEKQKIVSGVDEPSPDAKPGEYDVEVLYRKNPTPQPEEPTNPGVPTTPEEPATPDVPTPETTEEHLTINDHDKNQDKEGNKDSDKSGKSTIDREKLKLVTKNKSKTPITRELATNSETEKLPQTGEKKSSIFIGMILLLTSLLALFGLGKKQQDEKIVKVTKSA